MNKVVCTIAAIVFLSLFFFLPSIPAEESIAITTYYPSPQGSYKNLLTQKQSVGDTNGDGSVNSSDLPAANGQLSVARGVIYKPQSSLPTSNLTTGEMVYSSSDSKFYVYNGTAWAAAGSGGGCYLSYTGSCLSGFTNKGSSGAWGYCINSGPLYYCPPGGSCPSGYTLTTMSNTCICCQ